jgi:uncharacterized membrane protein/protein-disulfide isomerase
LTGLSLLGLGLSCRLSWHYLTGGPVIGCGGGDACDQVLNSRWSSVAGVLPVSGLAAGVYLTLLVAGFFIGPTGEASVRRLAWRAMLLLAGAAAGSGVWFIIVQKWIIGAFCPYCLATHVTGLLLFALVLRQAPRHFDDDSTTRPAVRPSRTMGFTGAGLMLAGLLAAGQAAFAPTAAYRSGESPNNLIALDPHAVPLAGSPDAPHVVTLLFDYKCPHCQQLHLLLAEAVRRTGGKVAFALCPAPLNTNCNPYIPRNVDQFKDSCELAKIGLAVWVAKPGAFPAFDGWMFSYDSGDRWQPRTLGAARARAIEMVGREKFDAAMNDPWINRYLQTCIRIYGETIQNGNGAVPRLVFGSRWVVPEPNDADDLVLILHDTLAVPGL